MIRIDRFLNIFQLVIVAVILFTFINAEKDANTVSYIYAKKKFLLKNDFI